MNCPGEGASGAGRGTVFIVEDDADVSDAVEEVLRDEGYTVVCARDGRQALEYLRANARPRLVLLDLHIPGVDGCQVLHEIENDSSLSPIPVIVMSGSAAPAGLSLPASRILLKPMDLAELVARVRESAGGG